MTFLQPKPSLYPAVPTMTPTSFKTLHSFVVNLDQKVTETTTRVEGGQTITTSTEVTKAVPHTIVLKEPSRKERQDLALFQQITYNKAIDLGLLPKVVMQQKVGRDAGSPLSGDEDKNIAAMQVRLQELSNDYMRLSANASPDTEDLKARKDRLLLEYSVLHKRAEDLNTAYQSVYAYTAESYQLTKTLSWLTLFLTYIKATPDGKPEPMFAGTDFAAKEERAGDLEDAGDALYKAAQEGDKLSLYWQLYLFNRAGKPEDFARIEDEWAKQVAAAEKMREEAAKVKADAKLDEVPVMLSGGSLIRREAVEEAAGSGTEVLKAINETPSVVVPTVSDTAAAP